MGLHRNCWKPPSKVSRTKESGGPYRWGYIGIVGNLPPPLLGDGLRFFPTDGVTSELLETWRTAAESPQAF